MRAKNRVTFTFGPATNSELWASYQNHFKLYAPEDIVTYERLLEWREANQHIFMSAREGGKRIAGVTMLPLEEHVIHSLIDEEIHEQDIRQWAIKKWSEKNLTVYIPSISIHHTGDEQRDAERGYFIIRSAIKWAFSLEKQCDIKKWYAIAATPEGQKLVQRLGFEKIAGKRDAYVLTDLKQATRPIVSFIERMEQEKEALIPVPREKRSKKWR